jgi:hypothetical protein
MMLSPVLGACHPDRPHRRRAGPRDPGPGGSRRCGGMRNDRQPDDPVTVLPPT